MKTCRRPESRQGGQPGKEVESEANEPPKTSGVEWKGSVLPLGARQETEQTRVVRCEAVEALEELCEGGGSCRPTVGHCSTVHSSLSGLRCWRGLGGPEGRSSRDNQCSLKAA